MRSASTASERRPAETGETSAPLNSVAHSTPPHSLLLPLLLLSVYGPHGTFSSRHVLSYVATRNSSTQLTSRLSMAACALWGECACGAVHPPLVMRSRVLSLSCRPPLPSTSLLPRCLTAYCSSASRPSTATASYCGNAATHCARCSIRMWQWQAGKVTGDVDPDERANCLTRC